MLDFLLSNKQKYGICIVRSPFVYYLFSLFLLQNNSGVFYGRFSSGLKWKLIPWKITRTNKTEDKKWIPCQLPGLIWVMNQLRRGNCSLHLTFYCLQSTADFSAAVFPGRNSTLPSPQQLHPFWAGGHETTVLSANVFYRVRGCLH